MAWSVACFGTCVSASQHCGHTLPCPLAASSPVLHTLGGCPLGSSCLPTSQPGTGTQTHGGNKSSPFCSSSVPSRVGFPRWDQAFYKYRLPAPWAAQQVLLQNFTMNGSYSLPTPQLATTARPGDLSLPQACKHRSHTRSQATAANKSWPQGSLKVPEPRGHQATPQHSSNGAF
jgi:hypothetical protein